MRILVSGMIAEDPGQGGATWAVLQYVLGLARLGHDVRLVEPIRQGKLSAAGSPLAHSTNAAYFDEVVQTFGLADRAALLLAGTKETVGLSHDALRQWAADADVLLNISGMLTDETLVAGIPVRVYLDLDPAFNQLWHAVEGVDMRFEAHTHFVTVGQAIGTPDCAIPACGLVWVHTLPPVVLSHWSPADRIERDAFTTIGNWRGYGSILHDGIAYGQKAHAFRQFLTLPTLTRESFQVALAIHPEEKTDLAALRAHGWSLVNPAVVAGTPASYRQFIRSSKAEIGIAKSGYVVSRSGWFSDRSACYLASGRPSVAHDTGFGRSLPTGEGLLAFDTPEGALAAIECVCGHYARHARAARQIAEAYLDSDTVLTTLIDRLGATR